MNHTIEAQWMGKMQFNALVNGHTVVMDAPEKSGGEDNGPTPKPHILAALAGCTGMDVVAILRKEGHPLSELNIHVSGETSKQAPVEYTSIHINFDLKGEEINEKTSLEAIMLSQEKYCGVSHMLKRIMPVTWEVHYNGNSIFNNKPAIKS